MPYGVCNAAPTFQRAIDNIFAGVPFVFIYLDDLIIFSPDEETHDEQVRAVLQRLRDNGLSVNLEKCQLFQREVKYLGHYVSSSGIRPLPKNVSSVSDFPVPHDKKSLQRFLGAVNYYRSFMKNLADILLPLTAMLKKSAVWTWDTPQSTAFQAAKDALVTACQLVHYVPELPLRLTADASDGALGAVLEQFQLGRWCPLDFWSKKLSPLRHL